MIELLIVIAIIGVLATLIFNSFNSARTKARDVRRKADLRNISTALEDYGYGAYPAATSLTPAENITLALSSEPRDPSGSSYMYWSDQYSYKIYTNLENTNDDWITIYPSDDPNHNVMLANIGMFVVGMGNVLHMGLDEPSGSISFADISGAGNNGVCSGNTCPIAGVSGKLGSAVLFDGSDDMIEIPGSSSLDISGDLTITLWVRPSVDSSQFHNSWNFFIYHRSSLKYEVGFYDTGGPRFKPYNESGSAFDLSAGVEFSANVWRHVAAVREGTALRIYIDGILATSRNDFTGDLRGASGQVRIGGNGSSRGFQGTIDEVSIYSRALTAAEILSLAQ